MRDANSPGVHTALSKTRLSAWLLTGLLCSGVLLPQTALALFHSALQPAKQDFLPPVATINGSLSPAEHTPRSSSENLEPMTLSAISTVGPRLHASVKKLDGDLGISTVSSDYQSVAALQKTMDDEDINKLWRATIEKNPVIRFSLEKLAIPADLHAKKSSQFLNRTLSTLISGAAMATTLLPGGGGYRDMGTIAGSDAVRNMLNGSSKPQGVNLTPTEQIQLAGLIDELQTKLVRTYHDYTSALQSLASAREITTRNNALYSQALASKSDVASLASGSAYYKSLLSQSELIQKASLCRLKLERLAGSEAVSKLRLALPVPSEDNVAHDATPAPHQVAATSDTLRAMLPLVGPTSALPSTLPVSSNSLEMINHDQIKD